MIWTGYYAKLKKYEEAGLVPVAISGKIPDFYKGARCKELAPRYESFKKWKNKEISDFEYIEEYKGYLDSLDKEEVRFFFESPNKCDNMILLCYEKSGDFCHRHALADWLEENFGYRVEEYSV